MFLLFSLQNLNVNLLEEDFKGYFRSLNVLNKYTVNQYTSFNKIWKLFKIIIQIFKFLYDMRKVKLINIKIQNIFLKYIEFMQSSDNLFEKYLYLCYFVIQLKLIYFNL